jgi:NAD+ diphosphatase
MTHTYVAAHVPPESQDEPALWFAFRDAELAMCVQDDTHALPCCTRLDDHGLEALRPQYLGTYGGKHCYAAQIAPSTTLPESWRFMGLRDVFGALEPALAALSGRAYQILEWDLNHRFCGRCGGATVKRTDERSRVCAACARTTYPPVTPAIMVLITDGHRRVLLAQRRVGAGTLLRPRRLRGAG